MIINTSETAYQLQQEQAAFQEQLETLKQSDVKAYTEYKRLDEYNGMNYYNSFETEAAAMIEEVNNLQGAVYTQEGKNALIQERLDALKEKYIQEEQQAAAALNKSKEELQQKLNDDLNASTYISAEETRLKLQDLEAETRSQLAFATHEREVEGIMKQLVERGQRDKVAAQFASKYTWMFAEKAAALTAGDFEKAASLNHIKVLAKQAKGLAYSGPEQAKLAVLEKLKGKHASGSVAARLIEKNADALKRKYK